MARITFTRDYASYRAGQTVELVDAAVREFIRSGHATKAVAAPPRNKSMKGRPTRNKAGHEDHAGKAAAAAG